MMTELMSLKALTFWLRVPANHCVPRIIKHVALDMCNEMAVFFIEIWEKAGHSEILWGQNDQLV